jgi:hypothetical protein
LAAGTWIYFPRGAITRANPWLLGAALLAVETLLTDPAAYDAVRGNGLDYAREFVRGVDSPGSAERRFVEIVQELAARRAG